jgi:hypothetical protein
MDWIQHLQPKKVGSTSFQQSTLNHLALSTQLRVFDVPVSLLYSLVLSAEVGWSCIVLGVLDDLDSPMESVQEIALLQSYVSLPVKKYVKSCR